MKIKSKNPISYRDRSKLKYPRLHFKKNLHPVFFSLLIEKMNSDLCSHFSNLNEISRFFDRSENMKLNSRCPICFFNFRLYIRSIQFFHIQ